jgi:Domain of unknown function (DUF389)
VPPSDRAQSAVISVTTIPAAANAAVALAYWVPSEAIGSVMQLVINLSAIAVAGTLTLLVLRAQADQIARRSPARIAEGELAEARSVIFEPRRQ